MSKKKPDRKNTAKKDDQSSSKQGIKPENKITGTTALASNKGLSLFNLLLLAAGILLLTFYAYQPALDNDFVDWDDNVYVIDNPLVRNDKVPAAQIFKQPVSLNYHPLTMLTMRWNSNECKECVHGISAAPFIQWNLIFHLLNTLLVFFLTYRLSKDKIFVALFSAAVFALHPMHVESVAWVSERKDVLYVFFFLLGLLSYDKYLEGKYTEGQKAAISWLGLALLAFVLSALSKAMAVVFPLVMIIMDMYRNPVSNGISAIKDAFQTKKIMEYLPFFGLALFFGFMAMSVQSGEDFGGFLDKKGQEVALNKFDTFSVLQRLHFAAYGFCMYIYKFFVPTDLCTFYPYPTQKEYDSSPIFWGLFVMAFLISALGIASLYKTKIIAFGIGFYFFTVAFVLQFISVGVVIMADRYTYLPYVGLAFMLAMLVETYVAKNIKIIFYGLAGLASIVWIFQTRVQSDVWQNSETLWGRVIALYPNEEQPLSIRGNYYGKMSGRAAAAGDAKTQQIYMDKAAADFQAAIALNSTRADVFEGMGNIYGMRQEHPKAIDMYNKAIQLKPDKASVYVNRGIALSLMGKTQESLKDMEKAVELDPKPTHLLYRGIARQSVGDNAAAKADYEAVLKIDPGNKQAEERLKTIR